MGNERLGMASPLTVHARACTYPGMLPPPPSPRGAMAAPGRPLLTPRSAGGALPRRAGPISRTAPCVCRALWSGGGDQSLLLCF